MRVPAFGPRPLFCRIRCFSGRCFDRKSTSGACVFSPKALSDRSMVWRLGRARRDVRREESAGGISERRRDVNMSSSFATWRVFLDLRTVPRVSHAGAPKVLPPRWISVVVVEAMRGARWGSMSAAVSSFRDLLEREKMSGVDMVFGLGREICAGYWSV